MKFPHLEVNLKHSSEYVRQAILDKDLEPYFEKAGLLTPGGTAQFINWHLEQDGSVAGSINYFVNKNLSVFKFRIQFASAEKGTGAKAIISAEHGPFSRVLMVLLYVAGFCLFIVGLGLSFLVAKSIQNSLLTYAQYLERVLKMWDAAT